MGFGAEELEVEVEDEVEVEVELLEDFVLLEEVVLVVLVVLVALWVAHDSLSEVMTPTIGRLRVEIGVPGAMFTLNV